MTVFSKGTVVPSTKYVPFCIEKDSQICQFCLCRVDSAGNGFELLAEISLEISEGHSGSRFCFTLAKSARVVNLNAYIAPPNDDDLTACRFLCSVPCYIEADEIKR